MRSLSVAVLLFTLGLAGCAGESVVSEEQRAQQSAIDSFVAQTLFSHDLDNQASYAVHNNGKVVIKFGEAVSSRVYTLVVKELRANPDIPAVYAEQSGKEVCGLVLNR